MSLPVRRVLDLARSPMGRKALKYSTVSLVSIGVAQAVFALSFGVLRLGTAIECNILATAAATLPSYNLNRRWAWGKRGKSHVWKEVVPFWTVAFVGLVFSTYLVDLGTHIARGVGFSHGGVTAVGNASNLLAYGTLWVGKFIIFNKFLFVDRDRQSEEEEGPQPPPEPSSADLSRQSA